MNDPSFVQTLVLPWVSAFATAIVPVLAGIGLKMLQQRNIDTQWYEAISRAGGVAYNAVLAAKVNPASREGLAIGAAAGADYLLSRKPGIVASKGLDPAALAQIAGAELGKLLAVDVNVQPVDTLPSVAPAVSARR